MPAALFIVAGAKPCPRRRNNISPPAAQRDIDAFIDEVLACCPMIRSLWLVADCTNDGARAARVYVWDVIAVADPLSLARLRRAGRLQRAGVRLRVMGDGNRLESTWERHGSDDIRVASDWQQSHPGEGCYVESSAPMGGLIGTESRTLRKAICLWQGIDPLRAPGS
jgi:hypothetical protein